MPRPLSDLLIKHGPLLLALLVGALLLGRMTLKVLDRNDDHLIYALDDAYIHMSIADNFSAHGVWGVTRHEFTSSTSSPLWTLLLGGVYAVTGPVESVPFVLNVIAAGLLLLTAHVVMRRYDTPPYAAALVLLLIVGALPLNPYIFVGLEHLLHAWLALLFAAMAAHTLQREAVVNEFGALLLLIVALLLGAVRYEGLFLVAAFVVLFALRRKIAFAVTLAAAGALGVVVYGLIAVGNGWPFLPVSITLKSSDARGALGDIDSIGAAFDFVFDVFARLADNPTLAAILVICIALWLWKALVEREAWEAPAILCAALVLTIPVQARLITDPGLFLRYHAYLIALGMIVVAVGIGPYLPTTLARTRPVLIRAGIGAAVALLVTVPLLVRYFDIRERNPMLAATQNIYQQQYQMGRFLHAYYDDATVVANDIGAITFLSDIRLVDIFGLGTLAVAEARLDDAYTTARMGEIAAEQGATIGIAYWHWITEMLVGEVPSGWLSVASWSVPNVVVLGGETVTFYSLDDDATGALVDNLLAFGDELPPEVFQQHYMIEDEDFDADL